MYIWDVFVELTSRSRANDKVAVKHGGSGGGVGGGGGVTATTKTSCLSPTWSLEQNSCI